MTILAPERELVDGSGVPAYPDEPVGVEDGGPGYFVLRAIKLSDHIVYDHQYIPIRKADNVIDISMLFKFAESILLSTTPHEVKIERVRKQDYDRTVIDKNFLAEIDIEILENFAP